jgi:hypothetical protein
MSTDPDKLAKLTAMEVDSTLAQIRDSGARWGERGAIVDRGNGGWILNSKLCDRARWPGTAPNQPRLYCTDTVRVDADRSSCGNV